MPLAGHDPESRAEAHLKWAARYAKNSDNPRAISHVKSALKYGELARARANADRRYEGPTPSKFGAAGDETSPFPAKSAWRKVTARGDIFDLNRDSDDHPYRAMADNERSPDDRKLGENYLISLPVKYNENTIYAYFSGDSSDIGGVFVVLPPHAPKGTARSFAEAIRLTNTATYGVDGAKELARLVLTKLVCDHVGGVIRPLAPSSLPDYSNLIVDGIGVSVRGNFKKSFALEYLLGMQKGGNVQGRHPGAQNLINMRAVLDLTGASDGKPRSVGNVHWLQRAYTENHRKNLDYFVISDDKGKIHSLIFAPYSGKHPKSQVIRDIGSEVPTEFVRKGNLVNDLTFDRSLDTSVAFAIRVYLWCMLVECEFIGTLRPVLQISKPGEESEMKPTIYWVQWSVDEDHTVLVSNNNSDEHTKFKLADLEPDRGLERKQSHDFAIQAIKAVWPVMPNKKPKTS